MKWHDQIWDVSSRAVPGRVLAPGVTHEPVKIFSFKRLHQSPVISRARVDAPILSFPWLGAGPDLVVWDTDWAHRHPETRGGDQRTIDAPHQHGLCIMMNPADDRYVHHNYTRERISQQLPSQIYQFNVFRNPFAEFKSHACNFYTFQLTLGYQILKHERTWFICNFQFWVKFKMKKVRFYHLIYDIKITPIRMKAYIWPWWKCWPLDSPKSRDWFSHFFAAGLKQLKPY